ncbi:MAG: hypothetical protein Q8Q35_01150 [Nanoarchaeota archaeon]|nr:hypothetical protein [Nanoarchaeota archaeon]
MIYLPLIGLAVAEPIKPGDLKNKEIEFIMPRLSYKENFEATEDHPEGTFIYYSTEIPRYPRLKQKFAISEFRFSREDGLEDVIQIGVSPQLKPGIRFRRGYGSRVVNLALGCNKERECEAEYPIVFTYGLDLKIIINDDAYNKNVASTARNLLRLGNSINRRMGELYWQTFVDIPLTNLWEKEISVDLTTKKVYIPIFTETELVVIWKRKIKLEDRIKDIEE